MTMTLYRLLISHIYVNESVELIEQEKEINNYFLNVPHSPLDPLLLDKCLTKETVVVELIFLFNHAIHKVFAFIKLFIVKHSLIIIIK